MILRFGIDCGPMVELDDEMTDTRMTPEVVEDYLRRLREQGIRAYQEIVATEMARDDITGDE